MLLFSVQDEQTSLINKYRSKGYLVSVESTNFARYKQELIGDIVRNRRRKDFQNNNRRIQRCLFQSEKDLSSPTHSTKGERPLRRQISSISRIEWISDTYS